MPVCAVLPDAAGPRPAAQSAGRAERFVMHLALALHRFGTPAEQLERHLEHVTCRLGLVGQFLATPTSVTASFGVGHNGAFYMVRRGQGDADLARLSRLERLADQVACGQLALEAADARIDAILAAPPVYGAWAEVAAYGGCSAAVARLFHGGWAEMLVAGGIGTLLGLLLLASRRWARLVDLLEIAMAVCSAIFSAGCAHLLDGALNQTTATLAGLIVLVPGLAFTVALTELSTGNLVAGTARLAGALVRFMKLGFGVAVGTQIGRLLFHPPPERIAHVSAVTEWFALVAAAAALAVILQVERREIVWVLLGSVVGLAGLRAGAHVLSAELAPCVAGLAATLSSHAYARFLRRTASVIGVPAMLLLVPGSVGYRSVAAMMQQDVMSGMQAAFAMGLNATGLVAGALLAGLLLPPHADSTMGSAGRP